MQSMGPLDQVMVPRSPLLAKAGADEEVPGVRGQLLLLLRLGVSASIITYTIVFLLMSASFDAIQS